MKSSRVARKLSNLCLLRAAMTGQGMRCGNVDEGADGGGWTGGAYVLGGSVAGSTGPSEPLSRREIIARAAEARMKQQDRAKEEQEKASDASAK